MSVMTPTLRRVGAAPAGPRDGLSNANGGGTKAASESPASPRAAGTAPPILKPIEARALTRPSWREWALVRENRRNPWIVANIDLLLAYYRATGDAIRASGEWTPPEDPVAEFAVWCDMAYESERTLYETYRRAYSGRHT